jgi:hypothetical protein
MQAIYTKYLPATNSRGSRIKATCDAGSITIPYPYELSGDEVHRAAAKALCVKLTAKNVAAYGGKPEDDTWQLPFVTGGLPNDMGYAHVFQF